MLAIERLAARDLDLEPVRERVDHGDADTVQAAGGLIGLGIEFSAGMQRRHDDFERRFAGEFRMRIDRDAAAVIGHGERAVLEQFDIDEGGVAGDRLVHGIVDHLGEEVVQSALIGAADIHAGPAADRLQPFEDLDGGSVVAGLGQGAAAGRRRRPRRRGRLRGRGDGRTRFRARSLAAVIAEKIVRHRHHAHLIRNIEGYRIRLPAARMPAGSRPVLRNKPIGQALEGAIRPMSSNRHGAVASGGPGTRADLPVQVTLTILCR